MTKGEEQEKLALENGMDSKWAYVLRIMIDQPDAKLKMNDDLSFTLTHNVNIAIPKFSGVIRSLEIPDDKI